MLKPEVQVYQIAWKPEHLVQIETGYRVLDNTANERPDWYEYWPIRRFWHQPQNAAQLRSGALDEHFFGFFSPKFAAKTLLTHQQMSQALEQGIAEGADVVLFSPQPDMSAFFLNVFWQQELFDPGFLDLSEAFAEAAGRPVALRHLVMDSQTTVFSNYFVAKGRFWREWLGLTDLLYQWAESPQTEWQQQLSRRTKYPNGAQTKVFLMERLASLILAHPSGAWRTHAANPWTMAWSMSQLREFPHQAVMLDALKVAMRQHGWPQYRRAYSTLVEQVRQATSRRQPGGGGQP